jgi:hypothetical protein
MSLRCYQCGASLAKLSLPLSRLDNCPSCSVELHVCKMCVHFAPGRPDDCDEDDAIEVKDKTTANFCDYFEPSADAFDARARSADLQARDELARLFETGGSATKPSTASERTQSSTDPDLEAAHDLFKK